MSDKILKALMQLFAIIANSDRLTSQGRGIVELFLKQQISQTSVAEYLNFYDEYLDFLKGKNRSGKAKKQVSVNSVKVLRICTEINSELNLQQKYIVIVRLLEFVFSSDDLITEQETEFLTTVADVFNIDKEEYEACYALVSPKGSAPVIDSPYFTLLSGKSSHSFNETQLIFDSGFTGSCYFLYLKDEGVLFMKYFGDDVIRLNGQPIINKNVSVIPAGSVIRASKSRAIYFNDIIKAFLTDQSTEPVTFNVNSLEYEFRNGKKGLHDFSFVATTGELIGIMGGSGAGKSTLLNLLNGNYTPSSGSVCINGLSIHNDKSKLEGLVGYVPQDDLLIDDLSVYQNLFYNSKLCFGNKTDEQIDEVVNETLVALGLSEIRDLKVGNVFDKTISGGQRKRLNIALELVRKPAVLFVDEPTSGLSSLDSENVMDLLKELSVSGKLVYVVIHQPSSDIFKLFDQLILLDLGGYPVYYGNPTDSLSYFKNIAGHADAEVNECIECGNINPDLIFSILEARIVDEFGHLTATRKIQPNEWYHHYKKGHLNSESKDNNVSMPVIDYKKPSRIRQFKVFFTRDFLSKLKNSQYMLINFLEAPVLAIILAYFLKFHTTDSSYVFSDNLNLTAYLFMCVIVALFMGLSVSAEEIIRDRKIQARESFLNLSRSSYLMSKIMLLFGLSAIQTLSFVIIGNSILEIQGMYLSYFLVLFSVSCFSNMLGLNISSAFNSAVTIYILIPFLIIPQIILSGVIVRFDNLNPHVTSQKHVPFIGEMMTSRWAFEALAVQQYSENNYEVHFFDIDKKINNAMFKKDFWAIYMSDLLDSIAVNPGNNSHKDLFINEFEKEIEYSNLIENRNQLKGLVKGTNKKDIQMLESVLIAQKTAYINQYKEARKKREQIVKGLEKKIGSEGLTNLKKENTNKSLSDLVNSTSDFEYIVSVDDEYFRKFRPIYMDGRPKSFIRAPFYVSSKVFFGNPYSTYIMNLAVIWAMTAFLFITLYFNHFKLAINIIERGVSQIVNMGKRQQT